jgi:RHS repeat-associated protein
MDYFPYGKSLREYQSGVEKYMTTHHERDAESGLDYRGARFYDAEVGRFLSLDPLAAEYVSWSAYNYVAGNPIRYLDPNGKWEVEINKENNTLQFKKLEGDNSKTLSLQLGISRKEARTLLKSEKGVGGNYSFGDNKAIQGINSALSGDIANKNCANFAMDVHGVESKTAFGKNGAGGASSVASATIYLDNNSTNISEKSTSIGDVVTYGITAKGKQIFDQVNKGGQPNPYQVGDIGHFAIVVLKSKDGKSVDSVIEKSGKLEVSISKFKESDGLHTAAPIPNSPANTDKSLVSPFYNIKK